MGEKDDSWDFVRAAQIAIALMFCCLPTPGSASTALPSQFDLTCQAFGGHGPLPLPKELRVDLSSGLWCVNDCKISHGGAHITGNDLILEARARTYDSGYKMSEVQSITVDTLDYFGMSEIDGDMQPLIHQAVLGRCKLSSFKPVTGPWAEWSP